MVPGNTAQQETEEYYNSTRRRSKPAAPERIDAWPGMDQESSSFGSCRNHLPSSLST